MKLKDDPIVKRLARELGLARFGDAERAIREYCVQEVEKIRKKFGEITDLNKFLEVVSSGLRVKFEEVNSDHDLQEISKKYLSRGELIFKDLHKELDDETDALLFELKNVQPWESKFIAVIDCRGYKAWRAYFSKWHEIAHLLSAPSQLAFGFRRTPSKKREPGEQIADRVAGDLAFYSPLFLPELLARVEPGKRLTFEIVEDLRNCVCPGASREATVRGAVSRVPFAQILLIADYGLKKGEERILNSPQGDFFPQDHPRCEEKLRAIEVVGNALASETGLRIHRNMEVPPDSVITAASSSNASSRQIFSSPESLGWWKHSRGQLENIPIWVEAMKIGGRVFALISQRLAEN